MPTYIMMINMTDQGVRTIKDLPTRKKNANEMGQKLGVERKSLYMTFGPYDFVQVCTAPSDDAMAQYALMLGSMGNVRTTVMRAFEETEHDKVIAKL